MTIGLPACWQRFIGRSAWRVDLASVPDQGLRRLRSRGSSAIGSAACGSTRPSTGCREGDSRRADRDVAQVRAQFTATSSGNEAMSEESAEARERARRCPARRRDDAGAAAIPRGSVNAAGRRRSRSKPGGLFGHGLPPPHRRPVAAPSRPSRCPSSPSSLHCRPSSITRAVDDLLRQGVARGVQSRLIGAPAPYEESPRHWFVGAGVPRVPNAETAMLVVLPRPSPVFVTATALERSFRSFGPPWHGPHFGPHIGPWCNGSTTGFGPENPGSNPGGPTAPLRRVGSPPVAVDTNRVTPLSRSDGS